MNKVIVEHGIDVGLAWHFANPFAEQRQLVAGEAIVELTNRDILRISGQQRLSWLQSLTTADFEHAKPGETIKALFLDPNGHIKFGLEGADDGECFVGWAEPGVGQQIVDYLEKMKFWTKADVELVDDLRLYWVGDKIEACGIGLDYGLAGGRLVITKEQPNGIQAGTWAFEALRIAAGIPRIGIDTDNKTIPNEIGLYATLLNKGCYTGQETVARIYNVGRPPRRLARLQVDGSDERLPSLGSALTLDDKTIGIVGSSAHHYEDGPIALALVKRSIDVDATLLADGIAATQEPLVSPDVGLHVKMGSWEAAKQN